MKKLIKQIVCNHPVATGRLFSKHTQKQKLCKKIINKNTNNLHKRHGINAMIDKGKISVDLDFGYVLLLTGM